MTEAAAAAGTEVVSSSPNSDFVVIVTFFACCVLLCLSAMGLWRAALVLPVVGETVGSLETRMEDSGLMGRSRSEPH